ncbi:MAG TPA: serine hydrolase domain-containing protein [Caldilineaceae bacterium]|nr:serine hydrolase domain-containing protein [Caldilineaceae bacterium]
MASAESAGLDPDRLARAYALLDHAVATGAIPGAALLVARHGQPIAPHVCGVQYLAPDSPPIRPDTIFLVASVTKPVTATAAMLLVERGKLLLNERAADYIPEFGNRGKEAVRIRHLLTHTSGLPDMVADDRALRRRHAPLSEFLARVCEAELAFPPGTHIQYQSMGFLLLAAIVERIEGVSFPDFLRREIFEPLGMRDTGLGAQGLEIDRIAQVNVPEEMRGADWGWNESWWRHFGAPWGGMFTTVGDFFRFCQLFLNGGELAGVRLLSPATVEEMTCNQTGQMPTIPVEEQYRQAWGLGWAIAGRRDPGSGWSNYGDLVAPETFGHGGATGTLVWADPTRGLVCILFTTEPTALSSGLAARCSNLVAAAALSRA